MSAASLPQKLTAEALGTAMLLAAVVGSGIMSERLADGDAAMALLGNTIATGAMLVVLITMLGPISGAHLNPAVSMVLCLQGRIGAPEACAYFAAQTGGAAAGVLIAHAMFSEPLLQVSTTARSGFAQAFSEGVATFGLVLTILLTLRARPQSVAVSVGLYITAAYWFTASTSFANPAVTLARALTDTFSGIRPGDLAIFVGAQLTGSVIALATARALTPRAGPALARVTECQGDAAAAGGQGGSLACCEHSATRARAGN